MAILSNINGKFAVDSTGAIQFSGAAGTSGYVLKSTGSGTAPTWVDPSTVIGGPYLPLTGGTLTGSTSTASGITFTVGGSIIFSDNAYQAAYSIRRNSNAIIFSGGTSGYYFNRHDNSVTDVYIDGSGNVGIGTPSPGAQLHNYSTATTNVFITGYGTAAQNDWELKIVCL